MLLEDPLDTSGVLAEPLDKNEVTLERMEGRPDEPDEWLLILLRTWLAFSITNVRQGGMEPTIIPIRSSESAQRARGSIASTKKKRQKSAIGAGKSATHLVRYALGLTGHILGLGNKMDLCEPGDTTNSRPWITIVVS